MQCKSQSFASKLKLSNGKFARCVNVSAGFPETDNKPREMFQNPLELSSDIHLQGHGLAVRILCRTVDPKTFPQMRTCTRHFRTSSKFYTETRIDPKKNYYHILGVTPSCSDMKIKQAYYRLSKVYHPDINNTDAAVAKFHEISEAYDVLSNPSLKHQYDSSRRGQSHGYHGVHRGTRNHPVNFKARGPHQYGKTDKYNYDAWMKEHYSEMFTKASSDRPKQEEYERMARDSVKNRHKAEDSIKPKQGVAVVLCTVAVILYTIIKMKKF